MTKEEVALQLTIARVESLMATKTYSNSQGDINVKYNEAIADETVKMYNTIYNNLDIDTTE